MKLQQLPATSPPQETSEPASLTLSTQEAAQRLGMAVRSVQLMVDRGELQAWKTPGGHRRIAAASVARWLAQRSAAAQDGGSGMSEAALGDVIPDDAKMAAHRHRVLLIEDSAHAANLVKLLMQEWFPQVELHVAHNGITGLITAGQIEPCVLLVDILLPGIDGATLVSGLRGHPAFATREIIILTALSDEQLAPYALALRGLPIINKTRMVMELPARLQQSLACCNPSMTNR